MPEQEPETQVFSTEWLLEGETRDYEANWYGFINSAGEVEWEPEQTPAPPVPPVPPVPPPPVPPVSDPPPVKRPKPPVPDPWS